jgi:hypothetical protein
MSRELLAGEVLERRVLNGAQGKLVAGCSVSKSVRPCTARDGVAGRLAPDSGFCATIHDKVPANKEQRPVDLETFVANSLAQIARGIKKAQHEAEGTGAWISPAGRLPARTNSALIATDTDANAYLTDVQFDVAVTVADEKQAGAGAGLQVMGMALGAKAKATYENAVVSRVQFTVPVAWPGQRNAPLEEKRERARAATPKRRATRSTSSWVQGYR